MESCPNREPGFAVPDLFLSASLLWTLLVSTLLAGPAEAGVTDTLAGDPLGGNGAVQRESLSFADLSAGAHPLPVDDSAFGLPEGAAPPRHQLEGTLTFAGGSAEHYQAHHDPYGRAAIPVVRKLPKLTLRLVQSGSHLIPADRGLRYTGHVRWNAIVGPGRVWSEQGDQGRSRAALPFALVERGQNCTHNGVLSFLFDGQSVSPVAYQITQETCLYYKFDVSGTSSASWTAAELADARGVRERYAKEVAARLPVRPLEQLQADYRSALIRPAAFGKGLDPKHITALGVVHEGVVYTASSKTRYGVYPFPESLRLPSYSTAKTVLAGAALMRLAEERGLEVAKELLRDHLPRVPKGSYEGVTFEHALDMTTGHYNDVGEQVDEKDTRTEDLFFLESSGKHRLRYATSYPAREPPGERWVYHTTDTFLLATALTEYLKSVEGPDADVFHYVVREVYEPLGLSAGALRTMRTDNANDGMTFGGYGLFFTRDDIAKLALLFGAQRGRIGQEQVLHAGMLDAAMQRIAEDRGVDALHRGNEAKYNNGVWARTLEVPIPRAEQQTETIWVPQMLGFGGIGVFMLPNGATFFYFGDKDEHSWFAAIRELHKLPATAGVASGGGP